MTPAGSVTTIYAFSGPDGELPYAGLIQATDGFFYGTTYYGGNGGGQGTVFKIDSVGNFTSLYSFPTASEPFGELVEGSDGNFYGTTYIGGVHNAGSVFRITPLGSLTTLYSFYVTDGSGPHAGLTLGSDGFFYGTTYLGGNAGGQGTIFKIDSSGNFTSLYSFPDAAQPRGGLVEGPGGEFFGTTETGGANGFGSVFVMDSMGNVTTVYSFSGPDGQGPLAGLTHGTDGRYYGTAGSGGSAADGVVFSFCYPSVLQPQISVSLCLPPNTSGLIASTPNNPGDAYNWTLTGGTIDSGQGTNQISFTSGPAATQMSLTVIESSAANCSGTASETMETDFADVSPTNPFYTFICSIARHAITGGCGGGNFCPTASVLRSQMAVFLLRSQHGSAYVPPPCTNATFTDVPCSNPFSSWIYELVAEGITSGCTATTYCPGDPVTRAQMAVFLLVTEHGTGYTPPACAPPGIFADVPCPGGGFTDWVYQLVAEGITGGCTATTYCPTQAVSRAQMAVFLVTTFSLP
jgi:uncharacterized repeat protein (TIGR03803 family)